MKEKLKNEDFLGLDIYKQGYSHLGNFNQIDSLWADFLFLL